MNSRILRYIPDSTDERRPHYPSETFRVLKKENSADTENTAPNASSSKPGIGWKPMAPLSQ